MHGSCTQPGRVSMLNFKRPARPGIAFSTLGLVNILLLLGAEEMAGESRVRHTALGALFAQQMDEVLALAAPVPENCTLAGQDTGL